ncbi:hypothetical protein H4Q26_002456 [Puccinia striiformis f. sp. tritici PST-130]|nr:hypothetical protein H4Q26_002456 [Puccinia striiformis f. sp. tritici PST-130]
MNENELPPIEEFDFPAPAKDYWDSDDERELDWIDTLPEDEEDNQPLEKEKKAEKEEDKKGVNSPWHPFRNKNYLAGSLIVGFLHKILSRAFYNHIRIVLITLFKLNLPGYEALRRRRKKIRAVVNYPVIQKNSSTGKACFSLSAKNIVAHELSNPLVNPHLDFFPIDAKGKNVFKLSQSKRWLQDLSRTQRVQMCTSNNKHYYIFEPVKQKASAEILVPIFFYKSADDVLFSKCIKPTISSNAGNENLVIQIPSDIRFHDPNLLALPVDSFDLIYSEIETKNAKTLSNLCGDFMEEFDGAQVEKITLPNPQMSTEGFDAYDVRLEEEVLVMTPVLAFLADSPMHAEITNTPVPSSSLNPCRSCKLSAPSLAEKVTMKYLQEFLQMSSHGTQCLNEHRHWPDMIRDSKKIWEFIKKKKSEKATDKLSIVYGVRDQLNRQFASEIYESKKLWKKLKKKNQPIPEHLQAAIPQHIADMDRNDPESLLSPYLKLEGVMISLILLEIFMLNPKLILIMMMPGFDGSRHTPVEILHVFLLGVVKYLFCDFMNHLKPEEKDELVGFWRSFNTESLNIPSVKPMGLVKYASSLVGKDFKVIIQAAPFLFFQFMDAPKRNIWIALCHLAPLVFQTHIEDMNEYLIDLKNRIDIFLYHVIQSSAQWINKPKFHMLLHLPESIRLYGPASLFATKKFESYNGILRNASIHSNRQSPGQDIAITFSSYHSFRQIFSGSMFYDMMKKNLTKVSSQVTDVFTRNTQIQNVFGYNHSISHPTQTYPSIKKDSVSKFDKLTVPENLKNHYCGYDIHQVSELHLNAKEVLKIKYFILFDLPSTQEPINPTVGRVNSIWCVKKPSGPSRYIIHASILKKMEGVNDWYQMAEFTVTEHSLFVNAEEVESCLNLQHNCHDGGCKLTKTRAMRIERNDSDVKALEITHKDDVNFILNSCSLHAIDPHRRTSGLVFRRVEPLQWLDALHEGFNNWKANKKKGKTVIPSVPSISCVDPSFLI